MEQWHLTRVLDIGRIVTGKTPKTANSNNYGGTIPFLTPSDDMSVKFVSGTNKTITEQGLTEVKNNLLPPNSVCVSCIGSDLGKVVITTQPTVTNQQINSIIVDQSKFDVSFVYYAMTILGKELNFISKTSTAVPIVNKSSFSAYEVRVPSLEEQRKISSTLSALDGKIANNNYINDNLQQQIAAVLAHTLTDRSCKSVKLGDYLYIKGRIGWKGLKKSEYLPLSQFRIINGESLTTNGIAWDKAGYISEERYKESPEIMLQKGDILLSKDGTIGKIGYVDHLDCPTSVASGIFVIRNVKPAEISTHFIYYLLKSPLFEAFIAARTEGSVIPHLYQKDFMEFEFSLPCSNVMMEFDKITAPLFELVFDNLRENSTLANLRDVLLPKLMSGELDVSEVSI